MLAEWCPILATTERRRPELSCARAAGQRGDRLSPIARLLPRVSDSDDEDLRDSGHEEHAIGTIGAHRSMLYRSSAERRGSSTRFAGGTPALLTRSAGDARATGP